MPTYEYECESCRGRFERRQRMTDEPVMVCPDCGGPVRRILFPVGIVFKGSGFYVTDNRRNGSMVGSSTSAESEAKGEEKKVEKVEAAASTSSPGTKSESSAAKE